MSVPNLNRPVNPSVTSIIPNPNAAHAPKPAAPAVSGIPGSADHIALTEHFGAQNYSPLDVVLTRGEGVFVWDVEGRKYFDFLSAYSALNHGHSHPRLLKALIDQAQRLTLTSRAFYNDRLGPMLEKVARLTGFDKVLPMNSGAEAVETAIKAIRRWGYSLKGILANQAEIIVAAGNFHGRTTSIVGFSTDPESYHGYGPATPGFVAVPYGDSAALEAAITPRTAGVLLEPIQGEAGVILPPDDYLPRVRAACLKRNVLLALDEIQTGLGRTGKMFAWQHSGARPDLLILGKALGGGIYPVSCVATSTEVMSVFTPGSHGSTFGGNPLAAALCCEALDILIDEKLPERAAELGAHAIARLKREVNSTHVREIRGRGLFFAVEYWQPIAKAVVKKLKGVGVLAKDTHKTTIRFAPPLVITKADLDEALSRMIPLLNEGA